MGTYPIEFQRLFPDEQSCRSDLFQLRWPEGYYCPRCEHDSFYTIPTRNLYECRYCHFQISVTSGTAMHGTRLPLRAWYLAMYLVANGQPCTARGLAAMLDINYRSALGMLRRIRKLMREENGRHPLSTERYRVEDVVRRLSSTVVEPVSVSSHERQVHAADQARLILKDRADAYIRRSYRRVQPKFRPGYYEEFYYRRTGEDGVKRFSALLFRASLNCYAYDCD